MVVNANNLKIVMPDASPTALASYAPWLEYLPQKFGINTLNRLSAFLAQIAHESGQLQYAKEVWGPTKAQLRYEKRFKDLGNYLPGDGKKYCGRGLIQITGRVNYKGFGQDFFGDPEVFLKNPELVEQPYYAVLSAIWFWHNKKLNKLADVNNFLAITRAINGGTNGKEERFRFWKKARQILQQSSSLTDLKSSGYTLN